MFYMDDLSSGSARTPTEKRNQTDPGDETSRRYRYQFGYGVILLVASVRNDLDYKAVWCEQREDFLGEISESFFDAYQVKTREPELGQWNLNDEDLKKSISRFVTLELNYPGNFRHFNFVSNAKFSKSEAKVRAHLSPIKLKAAVSDVASWKELGNAPKKGFEHLKTKIGADPQQLFLVLKKVQFLNGPPLESFEEVLALTHISTLSECSTLNAALLARVREGLIQRVTRASSLSTESPAVHYTALNTSCHDPFLKAKRLSLDEVALTIREVQGKHFSYLASLASLQLGRAKEKEGALEKKMSHGGLVHHYEMMHRRAISAEQILLDLATRPDDGTQIIAQVENVVLGECDDARLRAAQNPEPFGARMLIDVQDRLRKIVQDQPSRIHNQDADLLVGVAGLLTAECKVWWSQPFDLKAKP